MLAAKTFKVNNKLCPAIAITSCGDSPYVEVVTEGNYGNCHQRRCQIPNPSTAVGHRR
jgi:hypothetical protein